MTPTRIWKIIWPVLRKKYKRDKTFLDYKNPWQLLVAVVLSAQCTDEAVNKVTPVLFKKYPKPLDLAKGNIFDIEKIVHSCGFYRAKSKNIKKAAQMLVKDFKSIVPDDPVLIQKIPGVGRKSAVAIISNAFGKNIGIPVDTHVIRFAKRFKLSKNSDPDKIEQDLLNIIPKKDWKRAAYAMKEYGRTDGKSRGYNPKEDLLVSALRHNI